MFKKKIKIKYFEEGLTPIEVTGKGDWIDLRCSTDTLVKGITMKNGIIKKPTLTLIPLGVAMELPKRYEALVIPRSSTFKNYGLIQVNSPGIIDNSYKGDGDQWFYPVIAFEDILIKKDERICQFRIQKSMKKNLIIKTVEHLLGNKNRGGHGSTGTK